MVLPHLPRIIIQKRVVSDSGASNQIEGLDNTYLKLLVLISLK